ncbi:MAG: hypothetical protein O3B01_00985 [Planctomycetota bacterium]|nr:hypothetical protein [Planctomycetota bacterium]MDA1137129.1 hypothetical protein [Planctomycetota bacterium]
MNILDENVVETQCRLLRKWHIRYRQIGSDVGRQGMKDKEIVVLLHDLSGATFFTRDDDFFEQNLTHAGYFLVNTAVGKNEVAVFVRRVLRHPQFNTRAKRVGTVIRASHAGLLVWRLHAEEPLHLEWPAPKKG